MKWNKSYPYVVWLSTVALGPMLYSIMRTNGISAAPLGLAEVLIYFFIFGILFSAPAFFIYLLLIRYLLRDGLSPIATKSLSCLTALVTLIATFYFIGYRDFSEPDFKRFILAYALIIVFSSFVFKIKRTSQSA